MMMKLLLRVALLPVFASIGITRLVLKLGTKVYSWVIGFFWMILIFASVMIISSHQYGQLAIVGGAAVISFAVLFVIMWAEMSLEDFRDFLKSKI
ncbi:MAG: hypothetical protein ACK5ML_11265 [Lachnospiraceae bacterium]